MKIEELNQSKVPIIVFDKKLEQFRGKVLFPEKLKKANEILAKTGLPRLKKQESTIDSILKYGNLTAPGYQLVFITIKSNSFKKFQHWKKQAMAYLQPC